MFASVLALLLFAVVFVFVLWVRPSDLPPAPVVSPVAHLEERKASIHENLRDLTFEYRVGKLSDPDYQKSKLLLQEELAKLMAEIDRINGITSAAAPAPQGKTAAKAAPARDPLVCPHCAAKFDRPMKFCGECGKPIVAEGKA